MICSAFLRQLALEACRHGGRRLCAGDDVGAPRRQQEEGCASKKFDQYDVGSLPRRVLEDKRTVARDGDEQALH